MVMKKSVSIVFLIIFSFVFAVACFIGLPVITPVFAESDPVRTDIVLPESYEQLFSLSCPVDVDYEGDDFLILERDENEQSNNKLHVYRNGEYKTYALSDYNATQARFFKGRILFLSNSKLYLFDESSADCSSTGMVAATAFSFYGNKILATVSGGIVGYVADENDGVLTFEEKPELSLSINDKPEILIMTSEESAYYFLDKNIYYYNVSEGTTELITAFSGDARYAVSHGDGIYYSVESGVFCFDVNKKTNVRLNNTQSRADVKGIAFCGERLMAAYKGDRAIREIDLSAPDKESENFTLYAVTDRSDLVNRIPENVKDFAYYGGKLFITDGKILKIADPDKSEYSVYPLGEFVSDNAEISALSVAGDKIALIETLEEGGKKITEIVILSYSAEGLKKETTFGEYTSVTSITACEDRFYFINNTTSSNEPYAEINAVCSDLTVNAVKMAHGTGWKISVDIFGEIYISLVDENKNYVYSSERGNLIETDDKATDIFSDLDGNVYYLVGGTLYRFDGEDQKAFDISLWKNAPENATLKAMELIDQTDTVYLLYNGFILKTDDLNVSTPYKIAPPEDYSLDLSREYSIVELSEGTKLFAISLNLSDGAAYFDYNGYTAKSDDGAYILVREFSNYAVLADQSGAYIVRRNEYVSALPAVLNENKRTAFITNDAHAYKVPLLTEEFAAFELKLNSPVEVLSVCNFNGTDYSLVKVGEFSGYIPSAFLKDGVADAGTPVGYKKATVGKRGAKVYSSAEKTEILAELNYGDAVYVLEESDGISKIVYGDGVAFVETDALSSLSYYAVRNLIAILLLFVALFTSVIFILKTRVFKKKTED